MGKIKAIKLESTVSAYIELPVGVHTIADKIYTISQVIKNQGTEEEYKCNVIESIVPVSNGNI